MTGSSKSCTFCSCKDPAEYAASIGGTDVPLCAHHAALLGGAGVLALSPLEDGAAPRPVVLDHRRLIESTRLHSAGIRVA